MRSIPVAAGILSALFILVADVWAGAPSEAANPAYWKFAPKPPMGWNSYDCFGDSVTEGETMSNARYLKEHLLSHGWDYVVIDFRWYDSVATYDDRDLTRDRTGARLAADEFGRLFPAVSRFPSAANGRGFRPLANEVHAMGLKFGLHMMRGIPRQAVRDRTSIEGSSFTAAEAGDPSDTCVWCPDMFGVRGNAAGQAWYDSTFRLYASWGLDFIKVDDLSVPYHEGEIEMIRRAIDRCGRAIVLSTSPGPVDPVHAGQIKMLANQWRISGDFWDRWNDLDRQFDLFDAWRGVGGPGHFPDGDMIPFGHLGIRCSIAGDERLSRFTHDEEVTLISLLSLESSPLMLGANLPELDRATLALLTNDEVLVIDQDSLGIAARRVSKQNGLEVWAKDLEDGSIAIGLFNRTGESATIRLAMADAGLGDSVDLRDLWQRRNLGRFERTFSTAVPGHGAMLLRTIPQQASPKKGD